MQIIRITVNDHHLVTLLFNNYRVFYKQPQDMELAGSYIKARLENNESVIFAAVIEVNDKQAVAGFTQLYPALSSVRAAKNWLLNDLYVEAGFRKQGIGKALIKTAMDFAQKDGANYIKLETAVDNYTAQSLYEGIGFVKQQPGSSFFTYQFEL